MLSSTATGGSFAFRGHGLSLLRGKPPLQSLQTRADPPGVFGFSFRSFSYKTNDERSYFQECSSFWSVYLLLSQPLYPLEIEKVKKE